VRALLVLLVLARAAHAESGEPIEDAFDELGYGKPPPPVTKLGFRLGTGRVPLEDSALGVGQLAVGVEHAVFGKLRMLAEYEILWLSDVPRDPEMPSRFTGLGHRTNLGLRRSFAVKQFDAIRFYADLEAGGGLALYDVPGGGAMPHGFIGLRAGYQIIKRRVRAARVLEVELQLRAIVVEHGIGFGGGVGFHWGD
jgi:hypothetical protein